MVKSKKKIKINSNRRNTKRRNTKRKNNRHKNNKHKNRKNKTKGNKKKNKYQTGGMRGWRCCTGSRPPHNEPVLDVSMEPEPEIDEASIEITQSTLDESMRSTNILNDFFVKERGGTYKLNMDKIYIISCHGSLVPDEFKFTIVPKGLTLYLMVGSGSFNFTANVPKDFEMMIEQGYYISEYKEGSLIQDHYLTFNPFFEDAEDSGWNQFYTPCGLLEYDIPSEDKIKVKNVIEANIALVRLLNMRYTGWGEDDRISDRQTNPNHLSDYKDRYFDGNIDKIYHREYLADTHVGISLKLSDVLGKISEARSAPGGQSISGEWFGTFCRGGEPVNIEKLKLCDEDGLPPLPSDFFDYNVQYEGVSDTLLRQSSLSSKVETVNFVNTINKLEKDIQEKEGLINRVNTSRIKRINRLVMRWVGPKISNADVCFVFQMKHYISTLPS